MSIESVKKYLSLYGKDKEIIVLNSSSATVDLAAAALDVIPARIAKTLSFSKDDTCILVVTAGDTKIDNKKFKQMFGIKAKMLNADEVANLTGHPVGGVCPFALKRDDIKTYCDSSLRRFDTIFPACGTPNSAIEMTCDELFLISKSEAWVDVCNIKET